MASYLVRKFKDRLFFVLGLACVIFAVLPLGSILVEVVARGLPLLSWSFLTQTPGSPGTGVGGIGPAIQGTLILISLTGAFGITIGILSGVFLAEYGNNRFATLMRLFNDVLTEFPSIVAGVTVFLSVVLYFGNFSPVAGSLALSFILVPIVARTTEESIKLVPNSLREASAALGVRRWRTTVSIILAAAPAGLITGALLGIARIAGETAPLIMTVLGNSYYFQGWDKPMDALPLRIWRDALQPYPDSQAAGWGAALVLVVIVLMVNVGVRLATRKRKSTR
jgi:phosphate transport system permease protein